MRGGILRRSEREQFLRALKSPAHVHPTACPTCGKEQDAATSVFGGGPSAPNEGDVAVCLSCAGANQYGAGMRLEPLDWTKLDTPTRELVKRMQRTVAASKGGGLA